MNLKKKIQIKENPFSLRFTIFLGFNFIFLSGSRDLVKKHDRYFNTGDLIQIIDFTDIEG
jgi:hypothetical protein